MRLTVLGGSAAGPNVGQGCSGYLLDVGSTRLVLDLGPGTLPELRRFADFRTLAGLVVSHLHVDHVLDLVALRFALAYNPVRPPGRLPLWLPPGGQDFLGGVAAALAEPSSPSTNTIRPRRSQSARHGSGSPRRRTTFRAGRSGFPAPARRAISSTRPTPDRPPTLPGLRRGQP